MKALSELKSGDEIFYILESIDENNINPEIKKGIIKHIQFDYRDLLLILEDNEDNINVIDISFLDSDKPVVINNNSNASPYRYTSWATSYELLKEGIKKELEELLEYTQTRLQNLTEEVKECENIIANLTNSSV